MSVTILECLQNADYNITGFSAVPAGYRWKYGFFEWSYNFQASFWTATETEDGYIFFRSLMEGWEGVDRSATHRECGMSVRCIKDKL